jgi:hypothetical protein
MKKFTFFSLFFRFRASLPHRGAHFIAGIYYRAIHLPVQFRSRAYNISIKNVIMNIEWKSRAPDKKRKGKASQKRESGNCDRSVTISRIFPRCLLATL